MGLVEKADKMKKAVIVTDPSGHETEYRSQTDAGRAIGASQSSVSAMCRGYMQSWRGYRVRFKTAEPEPVVKPIGAEPCL